MTRKVLLLLSASAGLLIGAVTFAAAQSAPRITGTYSNMYFNKEGGDVLGEEIKIVFTNKGYQGALQFAEGTPSALMVVDIKVEGTKVSFSVPEPDPNACQFTGTIHRGVLKGQLRFKRGASEEVELKKGKSYWD
jgi:hypothetical protein